MPDETIEELTERLNRSLNMSPNNSTVRADITQGLNDTQKRQIREIVNEVLGTRQDPIVNEEIDQPIGNISRLEEVEKIPDIVRSLRDFSGQPGEFSSWRKSVDRIMELFKSLQGTGKYYAILHTIRTKIIGDADTALESYRTPLDWGRIKKCLMMHYSDKRDIGTLEYQMTTLCQGGRSITAFYQAVYQHLSLILDKVACLDIDEGSLRIMTNTYRDKALDTFVRGLNGDLPRLLSVREPTSLPQALHICLKLDNMTFRMNHAHGQISRNRDRIGASYPSSGNGRKFYPELAHVGGAEQVRPQLLPRNPIPNFNRNLPIQTAPSYGFRPQNNQWNQNGFRSQHPNFGFQRPITQHQNQNPGYPRPTQRIEPMDVDRSTQSKQVNYTNRSQAYQQPKRPAGTSFQGPVNKLQRNFHVMAESEANQEINQALQYHEYGPEEGAVGGATDMDEYYREFDNSGIDVVDLTPITYENENNGSLATENLSEDPLNDLNFFG